MNMKKLRKGATFIEYAMLAGLVAVVVSVAALFFGEEIKGIFADSGKHAKKVHEAVGKAEIAPKTDKVGP